MGRTCAKRLSQGINSRQRAELLILRRLIEAGELPLETLRPYVSEAVTPFAKFLQAGARIRCSEYLPEPDHWLRARCPTATSAASAYHRLPCSA